MWKRPNNFTGRWRLCTFNIMKVASTKSRFLINLGEDPSTILTHEPMSVGASVNITPSLNAIIAFSSKHKVSNDRKINPMWEIFQGERPDPPHLDWRRQLSWWRFCRLNLACQSFLSVNVQVPVCVWSIHNNATLILESKPYPCTSSSCLGNYTATYIYWFIYWLMLCSFAEKSEGATLSETIEKIIKSGPDPGIWEKLGVTVWRKCMVQKDGLWDVKFCYKNNCFAENRVSTTLTPHLDPALKVP